MRKTTDGWKFRVCWKDGSVAWAPLKDLTELVTGIVTARREWEAACGCQDGLDIGPDAWAQHRRTLNDLNEYDRQIKSTLNEIQSRVVPVFKNQAETIAKLTLEQQQMKETKEQNQAKME